MCLAEEKVAFVSGVSVRILTRAAGGLRAGDRQEILAAHGTLLSGGRIMNIWRRRPLDG